MKTYTRQDIEDYINSLPEDRQEHARQMQWKIDQTLDRCKDDKQRYNKMVEVFWKGVIEFQEVLSNPSAVVEAKKEIPNNIVSLKKD